MKEDFAIYRNSQKTEKETKDAHSCLGSVNILINTSRGILHEKDKQGLFYVQADYISFIT